MKPPPDSGRSGSAPVALVTLLLCLVEHVEKCFYHRGIELRALALTNYPDGLSDRLPGSMRPRLGDRGERISHGYDPRNEWDILTPNPIRVAQTVVPLVMVKHDWTSPLQSGQRSQNRVAQRWMPLDEREL